MKTILAFLTVSFAFFPIGPISVWSGEVRSLDYLQREADSILSQPNVTARRDINIVFELVDKLIEKNKRENAEQYLIKGLEINPWNLKYQILHAKILADKGYRDRAKEKAELVLEHSEKEELIQDALFLVGKPPLPNFEKIHYLAGTDYRVVLVPMQECEKWLILQLKDKISASLGIPVQIQTIKVVYPPYRRDQRGATLNVIRRNIKKEISNQDIAKALKRLNLSEQDLADEKKLLTFLRYIMPVTQWIDFEKKLEESKDKYPQWDASELQTVLFQAVKHYRRNNIAYLGVTSADIYAMDYNFLFGWAYDEGGVISYHRFSADFNHEVPNQARLIKRTYMQALSSIGFVYGIKRCTNPMCARAYPHSLAEHDAKLGTLCPECKKGFKKLFGKIPDDIDL